MVRRDVVEMQILLVIGVALIVGAEANDNGNCQVGVKLSSVQSGSLQIGLDASLLESAINQKVQDAVQPLLARIEALEHVATNNVQMTNASCPEWYKTADYDYVFRVEDDPDADDVPDDMVDRNKEWMSPSKNSGFIGLTKLKAMEVPLHALEVCVVVPGACVASCIKGEEFGSVIADCALKDPALSPHEDFSLSHEEKIIALIAGACEASEDVPFFENKQPFWNNNFFANERDYRDNKNPIPLETQRWANQGMWESGGMIRTYEHPQGWHVNKEGLTFRPDLRHVELGYFTLPYTRAGPMPMAGAPNDGGRKNWSPVNTIFVRIKKEGQHHFPQEGGDS